MPGSTDIYVLARKVLLDALDALGPHREAVTLVGAQAVYLRVGEADIAVAPTTTDADLSLNPAAVQPQPPLDAVMRQAGFRRKGDPNGNPLVGIWEKSEGQALVSVDLLAPAAVASSIGRRAARLDGHETGSVLKVRGIEASLVDSDMMSVSALETEDTRTFEIHVAGQGALLVAKIHKILDREGDGTRLKDKDALDVFRILRGTSTGALAVRLQRAAVDDRSRAVTKEALESMAGLFTAREGEGVRMTIRATEGLMEANEVIESLRILTEDLLSGVSR